MKADNNYIRLPDAYQEACNDPDVIVLGCHHLNDELCPKTCDLVKGDSETGKLEGFSQTD